VGIDMPGDPGPLPRTMQAYRMEGTPTLLVFDRQGQLQLNQLGQVDDMALGALLGELLAQ
ncbi:MAG: TlpA family protein disulfide reductase, partial [Rhodoferax sp.]|nr:TlpA family protein disulfide reductase [Rhodoferax sp.]